MSHTCRISSGRSLDDLAAGASGPDRELIGCRGAESVAGSQEDRFALVFQMLGQFGDRGRFARAVNPSDQIDARRLRSDKKRAWPGMSKSPLSSPLTKFSRFSSAVLSANASRTRPMIRVVAASPTSAWISRLSRSVEKCLVNLTAEP